MAICGRWKRAARLRPPPPEVKPARAQPWPGVTCVPHPRQPQAVAEASLSGAGGPLGTGTRQSAVPCQASVPNNSSKLVLQPRAWCDTDYTGYCFYGTISTQPVTPLWPDIHEIRWSSTSGCVPDPGGYRPWCMLCTGGPHVGQQASCKWRSSASGRGPDCTGPGEQSGGFDC